MGSDTQLVSCCRCEIGFWVTFWDLHWDLSAFPFTVFLEKSLFPSTVRCGRKSKALPRSGHLLPCLFHFRLSARSTEQVGWGWRWIMVSLGCPAKDSRLFPEGDLETMMDLKQKSTIRASISPLAHPLSPETLSVCLLWNQAAECT